MSCVATDTTDNSPDPGKASAADLQCNRIRDSRLEEFVSALICCLSSRSAPPMANTIADLVRKRLARPGMTPTEGAVGGATSHRLKGYGSTCCGQGCGSLPHRNFACPLRASDLLAARAQRFSHPQQHRDGPFLRDHYRSWRCGGSGRCASRCDLSGIVQLAA